MIHTRYKFSTYFDTRREKSTRSRSQKSTERNSSDAGKFNRRGSRKIVRTSDISHCWSV
jgi:hypothetical protein